MKLKQWLSRLQKKIDLKISLITSKNFRKEDWSFNIVRHIRDNILTKVEFGLL